MVHCLALCGMSVVAKRSVRSMCRFAVLLGLFCAHWSPASAEVPPKVGGIESLPEPSVSAYPLGNPGFERAELNWQFGSGESFTVDTSEAHGGSASLRFDGDVAAKYTPSVRYRLPDVTPGLYRLRFWIKTDSIRGPKTGKGGVRVSIEYATPTARYARRATEVFSGDRDWTPVEMIALLPESLMKGSAFLSVHRYGKPLGGKAWVDDVVLDRIDPLPIEVFLCYPNFRGLLAADGPQTVRLWIRRNASSQAVPVRITVKKASGALMATKFVEDLAGERIVELDARQWPLGEYRIEASAGNYRHPAYVVHKVAGETIQAGRVRFDPNNVLILRGKRTFPLGLYATSGYANSPKSYLDSHLNKISEAPINFLINYWLTGAPIEANRAYLEAQRKHGINYLVTVNNFHPGRYPKGTPLLRQILPDVPGAVTTREQAGLLVDRYARALRGEPNVVGWYVMDERPLDDVPLHFRQYQVLRRADPDGLTLGISNRVGELAHWRDTVDVLGMDPYPLFNMKLGRPLSLVAAETRAAVEATHGSRPVWMVIQFFQGWSSDRWPTEEELRTMSLMAVTEGARGLFYWSFGARALQWVKDPDEKERYWRRLVNVTTELKSLEPAMLAPDTPQRIASVSEPTIRWRARVAGDRCYVFAYLPAEKFDERFNTPPKDVTFTLDDGRTVTRSFRPDTADWFGVDLAGE